MDLYNCLKLRLKPCLSVTEENLRLHAILVNPIAISVALLPEVSFFDEVPVSVD